MAGSAGIDLPTFLSLGHSGLHLLGRGINDMSVSLSKGPSSLFSSISNLFLALASLHLHLVSSTYTSTSTLTITFTIHDYFHSFFDTHSHTLIHIICTFHLLPASKNPKSIITFTS
jgi:hypothetical protein